LGSIKTQSSHGYSCPEGDTVRHDHLIADCDTTLNEAVVADVAIAAYDSTLKYMNEGPDAGAWADAIRFYAMNSSLSS